MTLDANRGDREYKKFVETADGDTAVRTFMTGFDGDINVNSESNSVNTRGYIGKPSGLNGDFTTAYASATTITLSSLPSDVSSINTEDIISITQFNSSGAVVKSYYRDDTTITTSGTDPTTITVTGASFSATDSFVVMTNIERLESSTPSVSAKYISPSDFTATYTSSTTLTLSGLPFTISDSSQLVYIKKIPSTGNAEIYVNGATGITMTASSNILTISGAGTPFASGDVYEVGINAQDKSYDSSTNSELVSTLKNVWNQQTSEETLTTNAALTATFTQIGSDIDVREYPMLRTGVVVVVGTSTGITLRIVQKLADGSYIPIDGLADTTLTESKSYVFDIPGIETVAFQVKDDAAGTGTVSLYYNKVWR